MASKFLLLQYLLYMNPEIGLQIDNLSPNCLTFKSGTSLISCNRVCHTNTPSNEDIASIIKYFDNNPFTWAVEVTDEEASKQLELNKLHLIDIFPAMSLDLTSIKEVTYDPDIVIKRIDADSKEIVHWLAIVSRAFSASRSELAKFVTFIAATIESSALKFYLGYYKEVPAAASMLIQHGKTVTLHWVSTVPEFRNKGLGYAISYQPLLDAKKNNAHEALLLASAMGKGTYLRIGFKQYTAYKLYTL